ncbi:2,4'-dihydroxyacetophenone dioxygenase family protein [Pseudomonas aeruginosa]|uniref:2,4'-dihydroxyacetophenone dioxygenase family protein n=1 Tax=Pseudomonas aeruginosa TaxID=287 RepID=UPI002A698888|nr:2,4'-dihydroxyacetophenone dioxygenase family protein [Pseudomonas aeruginosa]MDY1247773.1 2,4'-dihydroxyacetophenone dioxygenase family protein [Pseudomonas aeruginosa]HCF9805917.1 2,4'-dihydroxyacetophenone dioxygenase family protein [Pseudomonas aeruginosa]
MTDLNTATLQVLAAMQGAPVVSHEHSREAILLLESDLPWVNLPDGSNIQLLHVDLNQNLWIVRTRMNRGFGVDTHYHTGPVFAVTLSGEWFYEEYPDKVNKAGSYLYEPAHSVHSLRVAADAGEITDVWFAIFGSNVDIDEKGDVIRIIDAKGMLTFYRAVCALEGKNCDKLIVIGE